MQPVRLNIQIQQQYFVDMDGFCYNKCLFYLTKKSEKSFVDIFHIYYQITKM